MQTVTNKQIYDRWEQIPEVLREAFLSMDNGEIIWKACEDLGLPDEVIDNVLIVTGNIILGFTHVNDLIRELQSIPGMDPKAIDPIIFQIDRRVFAPIKGEILKLYGAMSGTGPRIVAEEKPKAVEVEMPPRIVSENIPAEVSRTAEVATERGPAILQANQFETRKVKIGETEPVAMEAEQKPIDAPAIIHTEKVLATVAPKKHELSSFGGMFGFRRKPSERNEAPGVVAQVSMVQVAGNKPEEIGRTEQQEIKVVHYTSAKGPEDMFGQAVQQAQREAIPAVRPAESEFEPKVVNLAEHPATRENILTATDLTQSAVQAVGQPPRPEIGQGRQEVQKPVSFTERTEPIPTAQVQQLNRQNEVAPSVVVMKTPQRPEPAAGVIRKEPEPRLTEIPVADDVVDLRMLE